MAEWVWVLGGTPPSGAESRPLTVARGRVVTWRVDAPATAQFTIDGHHEEALELSNLATDLTIYRNGTKLFRGRIIADTDSIDPDSHDVQCTAIDYRGLLQYRVVNEAGRTFTSTDQGAIAWTLISESQALSGGNWGITNGLGATSGTARDRTYDPGKPLLDAISELGRVDGGFEWEIDANLALNRYYPKRGTVQPHVLDYGGVVASVTRTRKPGDYANSVIATGDQALAPARATSASIATDPVGRWEVSRGYQSIKEQSTLSGRATWLLAEAGTMRPELVVRLVANRWEGPTVLWIGDTATLAVNSGRLTINSAHRTVELSAALDEDNVESVTLGMIAA